MRHRILLALVWVPGVLAAQDGIDKLIPPATPFVTDAAHVIAPVAITQMNDYARGIQAQVRGDIAILTLPTIGDYLPAEVALRALRNWKVGAKGEIGSDQRSLGVVLMLVPKTAGHAGRCEISTGRGAEKFITDGDAGDICRAEHDQFAAGNYAAGLLDAEHRIGAMMQAHVSPPAPVVEPPTDWTGVWIALLALAMGGGIGAFCLIRYNRKVAVREAAEAEAEAQREAKRRVADVERDRIRQQREAEDQAVAAAQEAKRWAALTPEQRAAERAEQERRRREDRAAALAAVAAAVEEERRRRRRAEEERDEALSRSSRSNDDPSPSSSASEDSRSAPSASSDIFGGDGGGSGGGAGDSF